MTGHEHNALVDHLVGHSHGLLGIAGIVTDFQYQLLTKHAAGSIDVFHRHFSPGFHLLPERGILPGHRTGGGNFQVGLGCRQPDDERRHNREYCEYEDPVFHVLLLFLIIAP